MRNFPLWRRPFIGIALVGVLGAAHAVDTNARIKGVVTDPQGSVVANAQLTATNSATGVKFQTSAGPDGLYLFPELPVGTYTVNATAAGFKGYTTTGIVLNIDQEYVADIQLAVGSTNEVVEVTASSMQVNTTDMQLNNVVDSEQIVELPVLNRNFTGLELTLPGVQASSDRFGTYSVSGGQTQQSAFMINGADTNDIALNYLALSPNLDAIDQFNLIDGPLNAEYDRNSGGIVSATIKEGTNKFHGDGFEFYRDTFLNTLSYFQKLPTGPNGEYAGTVTPYHQNIFGGTVGGPILRNKLFFFGAYQGTRQRVPQGSTSNGFTPGQSTVYSSANLTGDFSADLAGGTGGRPTGANGYGNFSGVPIPSGIAIAGSSIAGETWAQCAYDLGGMFPTANFNSVATNLVSKYLPPGANGGYNFVFNPIATTSANQYIGRIDYSLNPANQITFLAIVHKQNVTETLPFAGASVPGFGDQNVQSITQYTFDYVHQFNPSAVNEFSGHYTRFNYQAVIPQTVVDPSTLGFTISPQNKAGAGVPSITINGINSNFELGFSTSGPQPRIDQVLQFDDSLSKVIRRHTLKVGYDGRRFNVSNPFSSVNNGSYGFNNTGAYSSGDGALDFLFGVPAAFFQGSGAEIIAYALLNYMYGQDTWKIGDTVTLSYGLGYSIDTPLHNLQYGGSGIACLIGDESSTVFPNAPVGLVYAGDKNCYNSGQATTHYTEFGPRFGFAWAPDLGAFSGGPRKLSIRGGFGIYFNRTEEETALQTLGTPPFGTSTSGASAIIGGSPQFADPFSDINGLGSITNPFPYTFPSKGATINWAALEPIFGISTFGPTFRAPYAENFQLSIEREFPSLVVARFSYVGSLARHNQIIYEDNPITNDGHAACVADTDLCNNPDNPLYRELQSLVFPGHTQSGSVDPNTGSVGFTSVGIVGGGASSSYHAFQVNIQKGTTHGLNFQLSYTYSHALDNGSSFENAGFGFNGQRGWNQWYSSLNYGDSTYDARQRLVFSPIYITPKVGSGSWYSPLNLALSGWEISGIMTFATGFPFDVSYAGGTSNSEWCPNFVSFYACPDAPNQVGPIVKGELRGRNGPHNYGVYIEPTSFANEPLGVFGNTRRNPYHGPGINNTNVVLAKNFSLTEDGRFRLQLRMETDNVFNHTQFNNPSSTWSDSIPTNPNTTFGTVSGTAAARQTQLAAKIYF
jgi:hypothetical protein